MRTPLFLHFCVLLTSTLFSNSCIMASEVIHLPAPIIKKVIHHSLASNPDEFSKTIEQARRIVSGIPNKQWHELVIQILYEEYKEDGATKLILACELSTEPLISIWIRRYICLQTNDSSRELDKAIMNTTPLISAVAMKSLGVTRLLLAHGVNPTKPNKDQTTPLMQAATEGDVRLITLLLNAEKNNQTSTLNNLDIIGETALYCAVANGHEEAAELLLERKACPNIAEFNYGYTSLHKAIERLDSELVILLLKHKANPNLLTKESGHPLYLVLLLSNSETRNAHFAEMFPNNPPSDEELSKRTHCILNALLDCDDIEVNHTGRYGVTPLHLAARSKLQDVCIKLIRKGANLDQEDLLGITPRKIAENHGIKLVE